MARPSSDTVAARPHGLARGSNTVDLALVAKGTTGGDRAFHNTGGLFILVGDGKSPHPINKGFLETDDDVPVGKAIHVTIDYRFVENPAYNRECGTASILAARLHAQF